MNTFLKADIIKGLTLNADFTYTIQNMNSGSADYSVFGMNNWAHLTLLPTLSAKAVPAFGVTLPAKITGR